MGEIFINSIDKWGLGGRKERKEQPQADAGRSGNKTNEKEMFFAYTIRAREELS